MHAKLLLLGRETPLFDGASGFVNGLGALKEPVGEFQVVGVVLAGNPQASFRSGSNEKELFSTGREVP